MPELEIHKPWPRPWTWAIALSVLLFGGHATVRWWFPALAQALFGDIPTPADAPPFVWALLAGWLILSFAGGQVLGSLIGEGSSVRDRHRWAHEQAERERQWALQRQLRELERQIREERLPEEEREAIRERRRRDTEIRREARRRLGLPEEDEANG
jgi:hypothetical protein